MLKPSLTVGLSIILLASPLLVSAQSNGASSGPSGPAPTATITQNLSTTVRNDTTHQSYVVSWSSSDATSCSIGKVRPDGITNPIFASGVSGSITVTPVLTGYFHLWINCVGAGGSISHDIYHWVTPVPAPNPAATCSFNGQTVASGSSIMGYQSSTVPNGQICAPQKLNCINGVISNAASYPYISCSVLAATPCTFNGQTVANGSSVIGYKSQNVPNDEACAQQILTCTNGILSNSSSYPYAMCSSLGSHR